MKVAIFEEFCEEFTREMNRLRGEHRANLVTGERELARLEARRKKLVESIMEGVPGAVVKDELIGIAARRERNYNGSTLPSASPSRPRSCIWRWSGSTA